MQCLDSSHQVVEKGLKCKEGLIAHSILKTSREGNMINNTSNEKTKFWSKNKNVTNDGVVDVGVVNRAQPKVCLQSPNNTASPNKN